MRLFLGLNLDPAVRRRCYEATAPLRAARPDVHWVTEPKLHLTLKFLGEQEESVVSPVAAALDRVAGATRVMDLALGSLGAFPNFRRPRIVWVRVAPDPKLELLHHDIEVACEALGFGLDGRPFRPHVTLGRVIELRNATQLREAARRMRLRDESPVRSIDLMQSRGGAYRLLHASPLDARER